ncbi:MAG: hypothetical protein ACXVGH_02320 [Mycobacteriales bacterium]
MDLVQVSMAADGTVVFSCRVCGDHCPAPEGVPLAQATREFLDMHPACADPGAHDEGCPPEVATTA